MTDHDVALKEVYLNKPECVVNFPESLLPLPKIEEFRAMPRLAIVEVAGRDSVAAALKSVEERHFTDLVPVYVYTGTEYGLWYSVKKAVEHLSRCLSGIRVHQLLVLGSPDFWRALNGRYISELISKYGFFTPCVGCHIYLHSVRIPLASKLGKIPIIAGERERHDASIKVNQIPEALNVYERVAEEFGIELLFPLRNTTEGDKIKNILGFNWEEGKEQLGCVLSGNYQKPDGSAVVTSGQIQRYLEEFAYPLTKKIIATYLTGRVPQHSEIAAEVLGS